MAGLELRSPAVIGNVDELREAGGRELVAAKVPRGSLVTIRGWLLDHEAYRPVDSIVISLSTGSAVKAVMGLARPDVAAAFGSAAGDSGFVAAVPADAALGAASLSIRLHRGGNTSTVELDGVVTIVPAPDPFAGLDRGTSSWAFAVDGAFVGEQRVATDSTGAYIVDPRMPAQLRMWAIDHATREAPRAVAARFGGRWVQVGSTIERPDAAASQRAPGAVRCGFAIPLVPSPFGTETIELYAFDDEGSYAHLISVRACQLEPLPSSLLPGDAPIASALDSIDVAGRVADGTISASPGEALHLRGWAIDEAGPRLVGGVDVLVDDDPILQSQTRLPRPDVAAKFDSLGVLDCGFDFTVTVPALQPGPHKLVVRAFSARRDATAAIARRELRVDCAKGDR